MKSILFVMFFVTIISACNNNSPKDTVDLADSANKANIDSAINNKTMTVDEGTAEFLVKAANGVMAEVDLSGLAQQKGSSAAVKDFASLMISDHSSAGDQIKMLAAAKNVILPEAPSKDKQDAKILLSAKSGNSFDKAYMEMMIKDHQETIELFEKAITNVKDPDVSAFADKSLPGLREHLNKAKAVRKSL